MIVGSIAAQDFEGSRRVSAKVRWEDTERSDLEVFFEYPSDLVELSDPPTEAFALATFLAAWRHGERRLRLDNELCPVLREGLYVAMAWLREWYQKPGSRGCAAEGERGPGEIGLRFQRGSTHR